MPTEAPFCLSKHESALETEITERWGLGTLCGGREEECQQKTLESSLYNCLEEWSKKPN